MGNKTIYFKDDELWDRAKQLAGKETISAVIQEALAEFVDKKRREAEGFTHHRLETGGLRTDLVGDDWRTTVGTTERIAFEGRQIATQELQYTIPEDSIYAGQISAQEFTVYRTKAEKLLLVVNAASGEDACWLGDWIFHWGVYSSIRELADDPELRRANPIERAKFLDAISKQVGQDWAVWID